jgi:hypothetical protein
MSTDTDFSSWSHENLARFAKEANAAIKDAEEAPTLRDIFAAFALVGLFNSDNWGHVDRAGIAYQQAAAMMNERERRRKV